MQCSNELFKCTQLSLMEWINDELKGGLLMFDLKFVFKAQCCLVWNWNMEIVELKVSSLLLSLLE